jgi:hypothetical protein
MRTSQFLLIATLGLGYINAANAQAFLTQGNINGESSSSSASSPNSSHFTVPPSVATMVCHESGGSGYPLTDYVNNIDLAIWNPISQSYTNTLPNGFPIYPETSSNPTSCAVATSQLASNGLTLKQVFSHFPGYYIEVFSSQ